jgi:hypothetical protein
MKISKIGRLAAGFPGNGCYKGLKAQAANKALARKPAIF